MTIESREKPVESPPVLELRHPSYQPNKAELEEDLRADATHEELVRAVVRPVKIRYVRHIKRRG